MVTRGRRGGASRAQRLGRLINDSLDAMPGLSETDAGRQARRDFVIATHRSYQWGGLDFAERFAGLITELYEADRGDTGRALTRDAVLPLASVFLIRDPIFVASMATGAEQRRRIRQALNVKLAREDELKRRYLTRFEAVALGRRFRADIRSSDWPARVVAAAKYFIPRGWRGTRRERELREYLIDFVKRATRNAGRSYERYQIGLARLHKHAMDHRLRGMALSEAKMLTEHQQAAEEEAPA